MSKPAKLDCESEEKQIRFWEPEGRDSRRFAVGYFLASTLAHLLFLINSQSLSFIRLFPIVREFCVMDSNTKKEEDLIKAPWPLRAPLRAGPHSPVSSEKPPRLPSVRPGSPALQRSRPSPAYRGCPQAADSAGRHLHNSHFQGTLPRSVCRRATRS